MMCETNKKYLSVTLVQAEGDELTGICLPGQQTEATLLHQLVIPHAIFLGQCREFKNTTLA